MVSVSLCPAVWAVLAVETQLTPPQSFPTGAFCSFPFPDSDVFHTFNVSVVSLDCRVLSSEPAAACFAPSTSSGGVGGGGGF